MAALPPQPTSQSARKARYTREQVLDAERRVWVGSQAAEMAEFFYDGIAFWRRARGGQALAVGAPQTPQEGWRHKEGCNCTLCRARAAEDPSGRREKMC